MKLRTLLIGGMIVISALIGGTTYAHFNDKALSQENTFNSGTLEVLVNRVGDTLPGPMFYVNTFEGQTDTGKPGLKPTGFWAPGDEQHRILSVKNNGTLNGEITSIRANLDSGSRGLADKLYVKVTSDAFGKNILASGTLGQFIDREQRLNPVISLNVRNSKFIHFWVSFPGDADNSYQGKGLVTSFNIFVEQSANKE